MLYDPCVLQSEVEKLRNIVKSCIKKHVITPTTFLSPEKVGFINFLLLNVSIANLSNFCHQKISAIMYTLKKWQFERSSFGNIKLGKVGNTAHCTN